MNPYRLKEVLSSFPRYIGFIFRDFPLAYLTLVAMLIGVVAEYVALSLMIPLSSQSGGKSELASRVVDLWREIIVVIGLPDQTQTWLWLFLLVFGLRLFIGLLQTILNTAVAKQVHSQLSSSTFSQVVSEVPMHEIYRQSVGHYMALAGDDSIRVGQLYFSLIQALSALLAALIGLVVLFLFSQPIFVFTIIFLIVCAVILGLFMRRVIAYSLQSALLSREASTAFVEALNGLRSIRSMGGEGYVSDKYRVAVYRYAKLLFTIDVYNHSSRTLPGLLLLIAAIVILFPGAQFVGDISVVYFFTVTTLLVRVLSFLGVAVYSGGRVAVDIRAVLDLDQIIAPPIPTHPSHGKLPILCSVNTISMANMSCGYVNEQPVLMDITAQLSAGRCYALVGKSGSGKSTLSDVLLGLLTPTSGKLHIDKLPYEQLDLTSLRRKVVLVEQQTRIFSGSVRENISFGLALSEEDVRAAIEAAGLGEFVSELPDGLETRLDYQGANVSGGQRQRIGLARAIVRQPDVLILDEATSALDGQTRDQVLQNLKTLFRDRILLFITHDHYVIQHVDEVWHIKKGKLVIEKGTGK